MKIPKHIKVGGHVYQVTVGELAERMGERSLVGESRHLEGRIFVSTKTPTGRSVQRSAVEEIFVHELLHAVDRVYNASALNEETVARLSHGLYQVLTDNKLVRS